MKDRPQNRNLRPNPHTLGVTPLANGLRRTKAFRFTLPDKLADKLESLSKVERDALISEALRK